MLDEADRTAMTRRFAPSQRAPRLVRNLVREALASTSVATRSTATLLASELATNAVVHARSEFEISVDLVDHVVRVTVTDRGGGRPTVLQPDTDRVGGRGLWMISQMSSRWGTTTVGSETAVWFELDDTEG